MKMMKKTLLATALLATTSTAALAEISGNVALTTDYVFRGISQTDNDPAIQGGFDYSHESGFYIGTWGSNVDFLEGNDIELDYYAGIGGEMANGIGYDVGVIYYDYPAGDLGAGAPDAEFVEVYGGLSGTLGAADVSGKISYSPDYFGESGSAYYIDLGAGFGLANDFGLAFHVGYQSIDEAPASQAGFFATEEDSYVDWSVGLSKSVGGVDLGLTYTDTNLDSVDCFDTDICDATVFFSVSKSL
jgi:uncharacterized protein (TIGR02001 family)